MPRVRLVQFRSSAKSAAFGRVCRRDFARSYLSNCWPFILGVERIDRTRNERNISGDHKNISRHLSGKSHRYIRNNHVSRLIVVICLLVASTHTRNLYEPANGLESLEKSCKKSHRWKLSLFLYSARSGRLYSKVAASIAQTGMRCVRYACERVSDKDKFSVEYL